MERYNIRCHLRILNMEYDIPEMMTIFTDISLNKSLLEVHVHSV